MSKYQHIGVSFASAVEAGNFLREMGFESASEGYSKVCELTGETIEVSYTLTKGRCFISMKPRNSDSVTVVEPPHYWEKWNKAEAIATADWFLEGNDEYDRFEVVWIDDKGWSVEVWKEGVTKPHYALTWQDF